jgi:hypothetical protein
MFSRMELDSLMTADVPVAVSLYLPTHVKGREIRQDSIRLKNLTDAAEAKLIEYLSRIDTALRDFLAGEQPPLILAAEPEIDGHFRSVTQLRNLLPETIQCNPEALSPEELHARAYAIVRPGFEEGLRSALAHFKSLQGNRNSKASIRPEEIVKGANDSRVDALFLAEGAALWGRVTDQGELTAAHTEPRSDDEDLTDFAAVQTLQHGGVVYHVPPQELPPGAAMAAVFRW